MVFIEWWSTHFGKIESDALAKFFYHNLKQFNIIKNRKNSILDLILFNSDGIYV